MTQGRVLRIVGGGLMGVGLVTILSPGGNIHWQVLMLLAGIFLSFCGMCQP